jgi:hypothetical protein
MLETHYPVIQHHISEEQGSQYKLNVIINIAAAIAIVLFLFLLHF